MTTPTYDLVLLLDTSAPEDRRAKIRGEVEQQIEGASGTIVGKYEWGVRRLAYPIGQLEDAEYHLLQFTGPPELPGALQRSLKIADGVVRSRVIRLDPGMPPPPQMRAPEPAAATSPPAEAEAPPAEATSPPAEAETPPAEAATPPAEAEAEAPPADAETPPAEAEAEAPPADAEAPAAEATPDDAA